MKNTLFLFMGLSLAVANTGFAANVGDPQEVNLKVYTMWASLNTDCSSATQVFNEANPQYKNLHGAPDFGSGSLAHGDYTCIAVRMSDLIKFKPDYTSDGGNCVKGVESEINVFREGETSTCPDGASYSGTDGEDTMCVYFGTAGVDEPEDIGKSPFQAPGFKLQNAWTVGSDKTGRFIANFNGKIEDNSGDGCDAQPPTWDFQ